MKKYLPIILGILFLTVGIYLYTNKSYVVIPQNKNVLLTKEEAISLIENRISNVIDIYERPSDIFELKEVNLGDSTVINTVVNYQDVVISLFSENGIKQLENTKFNNKNYITKNDNYITLLEEIPIDNRYSNSKLKLEMVNVLENEITAQVIFSSNNIDKDGILNYYIIKKNIKLIKIDDKWYVEDFIYNNS